MDSHDVGCNCGGVKAALEGIGIPAMVLGIDSDVPTLQAERTC